MDNLRSLAEADLKHIIENPAALGTPYVLIDEAAREYPVVGTFSDIGALTDPVTGEIIQGRTIEATCRVKTVLSAAGKPPAWGWKARVRGLDGKELFLFIRRNEPDNTIGVYRLTLGLKLKEGENGEQ
jgi:hypothetical protein